MTVALTVSLKAGTPVRRARRHRRPVHRERGSQELRVGRGRRRRKGHRRGDRDLRRARSATDGRRRRRRAGAAWRAFCDRLAAVGDRILGDDFPGDPGDRAEGVHHLATQAACWLTYATGFSDPAHPAFFRSADPTYRWGGPNVDQVGTPRRHRRRGHLPRVRPHGVVRGVRAAAQGRHDPERRRQHRHRGDRVRTRARTRRRVRDPARAPTNSPGTWLPLGPGPGFVHVRDYYFDWAPAEPATFVIERLDTQGDLRAARSPPTASSSCSTPRRTRSSTRSSTSATSRPACATRRSRTGSACPTSRAGACRTSSTATASCSCATTRP